MKMVSHDLFACQEKMLFMGFVILGLDFVISQMMNCHKSTITLLGGERLGLFFFHALLSRVLNNKK